MYTTLLVTVSFAIGYELSIHHIIQCQNCACYYRIPPNISCGKSWINVLEEMVFGSKPQVLEALF